MQGTYSKHTLDEGGKLNKIRWVVHLGDGLCADKLGSATDGHHEGSAIDNDHGSVGCWVVHAAVVSIHLCLDLVVAVLRVVSSG